MKDLNYYMNLPYEIIVRKLSVDKFLTELIENSAEFKEWQTKEKAKSDKPKLEL